MKTYQQDADRDYTEPLDAVATYAPELADSRSVGYRMTITVQILQKLLEDADALPYLPQTPTQEHEELFARFAKETGSDSLIPPDMRGMKKTLFEEWTDPGAAKRRTPRLGEKRLPLRVEQLGE